MSKVNEWVSIKLLIAAISGGLITGTFNYLTTSRQSTLEEINLLIDQLKDENLVLKRDNSELVQLREEVRQLRMLIVNLESSNNNIPIPLWFKSIDFKVLWVNDSYEEIFLIPMGLTKYDYIGKYDHEVYPISVANRFRANDLYVVKYKREWRGIEKVPTPEGGWEDWWVVKYPRYASGVFVGVGGMAWKVFEPP